MAAGTKLIPLLIPPDQRYDVAPAPDSVTELPVQVEVALVLPITVGSVLTVTATGVLAEVQVPFEVDT